MTIVKSSTPRIRASREGRRFRIESDEYSTEYTQTYLGALFHYYGMRLSRGGTVTIIDQIGE